MKHHLKLKKKNTLEHLRKERSQVGPECRISLLNYYVISVRYYDLKCSNIYIILIMGDNKQTSEGNPLM